MFGIPLPWSPHIFTLSQSIDDELMQRVKQEEVHPSREFAEENYDLLAEASTPKKRRQKGLQYQMLTIGD
jgi:hypothetical protein